MKNEVMKKCDLLGENVISYRKGFWWEHPLFKTIAALSYTESGKSVDVQLVKECRKKLKKRQSILSYFRGNNELIAATGMALSDNPDQYLEDIIAVYGKLQSGKFFGSSYRALSAMVIADAKRVADADAIIEKTNVLMKGMKSKHPFLTTDQDTCLAVIMAMADKSAEAILEELENTYASIKGKFLFHENAVYSLAQVLTSFEGDAVKKSEKTLEIFNAFKAAGSKYGKEYELASLGLLTNISMNNEDIVSEVVEAAEYLKKKKGFRFWDMTKQTRLMVASTLVYESYAGDDAAVNAAVVGGTLAKVIAEEIMLMVIVASSAAASSSSSH